MSYLEAWAEPRYKPIASLAQVMALSAGACHQLIEDSRRGRFLSLPEADSIAETEWCDLYRRPTRVRAVVFQAFQKPDSVDDLTQACIALKVEHRQFHDELREQLQHYFENGCTHEERLAALSEYERIYHEEQVPMLRQMIADAEPVPEQCRQWFGVPEFNFFMAVGMPCWLEYQTTPFQLFHRAANGDFDALEALMRLDESIGSAKRLRKPLFDIRKQSPARSAELNRARLEGRKTPISLGDVKYLLGAWLMDHSKRWQYILNGELHIEILKMCTPVEKHPQLCRWIRGVRNYAARNRIKCELKATDIPRLFHAAARDTQGISEDGDFLQSMSAIRKRLNRNSLRFTKLQNADKRRAA